MKQITVRNWICSTTLLATVLFALVLGVEASPAKIDASRQAAFSYAQYVADDIDFGVAAENEIHDYRGYEVWRLNLRSDRLLAEQEFGTSDVAKHVLDMAGVSLSR
jgi:hypothetical protein